MKTRNRIVIYNIETNKNSKVLASTIYWIQAFAEIFDEVLVYSVHVGEHELPSNVSVTELGGGTHLKKIGAIFRLLKSVVMIIPDRKSTVVFHHMSSRTAGTVGALFSLLRIPQGLWYSHSYADPFLIISKIWVNFYFSPTQTSFPTKSKRVNFTGHGIPTDRFLASNFETKRDGIVSIGRIVRVKNLEDGIKAIGAVRDIPKVLHLYGESLKDDNYLELLKKLADSNSVEIKFHGLKNYDSLPAELQKYSVVYSGTPKSTDKALLEAAVAGCFPLTDNRDAEDLTGMSKVWEVLKLEPTASLATKLSVLTELSESEERAFRRQVSVATCASSDVKVTVSKISNELRRTSL